MLLMSSRIMCILYLVVFFDEILCENHILYEVISIKIIIIGLLCTWYVKGCESNAPV